MSLVNHEMSLHLAAKQPAALRDSELLSVGLAGSIDAFAELHRIYALHVYFTTLGITRNREDAEDALQDTFLRAYLALPSFEGRSSFNTWLTRIAINSALMLLRKRRSRNEMSFDSKSEMEDDLPEFDVEDSGPNPEQVLDQHQRCVAILDAIQKLKPNVQRALEIRLTHEGSLTEIAQTLDISEAAVKSRLHRARARLSVAPISGKVGARPSSSSRSKRKERDREFGKDDDHASNSTSAIGSI